MMNTAFTRLPLVNTYGAFGSVGRERDQLVFEGTTDAGITPATIWREYEWKCQPGDPARRPCWMSPYHYRLDWLLWFAAMGEPREYPWAVHLTWKLLEADRDDARPARRAIRSAARRRATSASIAIVIASRPAAPASGGGANASARGCRPSHATTRSCRSICAGRAGCAIAEVPPAFLYKAWVAHSAFRIRPYLTTFFRVGASIGISRP